MEIDALQLTLRFSFRVRLMPGVRRRRPCVGGAQRAVHSKLYHAD
jgi:hypothetical protein